MKPSSKTPSLIYVFTGNGKGKTSAALGVTVRMLLNSKNVAWYSWYKQSNWDISEFNLPQHFPKFHLECHGHGFYIPKSSKNKHNPKPTIKPLKTGAVAIDSSSPRNHQKAAKNTLESAKTAFLSQKYDLIILDEINNAIDDQLLNVQEVLDLIQSRGKAHVVLTGRNAHPELIKAAHLVSKIQNIKHPFDQGIPAVKGLDF
jgi:cob(I)alamin adenosyltransferase